MKTALSLGLGVTALGVLFACQDAKANPLAPEAISPQFAKPPAGSRCRVGFDLVLDENQRVRSDIANVPYRDKQENVMVSTSGTGLRFDTNTSIDLETATDLRRARLDFTGTGFAAHSDPNVPKGIDLRFSAGIYPVNLCDLGIGQIVKVPAGLNFISSLGGVVRMAYGWNPAREDDFECDNLYGDSVRLTIERTTANTWQVSGTQACFYYPNHWGELLGLVPLTISFTLTAQ